VNLATVWPTAVACSGDIVAQSGEGQPFRMKMASEFGAREWNFLSAPIPLPQIRLPTFFSVVAIPGMR
jgi:hypothetical protein